MSNAMVSRLSLTGKPPAKAKILSPRGLQFEPCTDELTRLLVLQNRSVLL
jgi:hypothetical protein